MTEKTAAAMDHARLAHTWRGIDWREAVDLDGLDVTLRDGTTHTLSHYPGEGTHDRAAFEFRNARAET